MDLRRGLFGRTRELAGSSIRFFAFVFVAFAAGVACAEDCPRAPTAAQASTATSSVRLEGRLVYHNGIRQWFELKLGRPVCGQASVQIVPLHDEYRPLEILRGCRVASVGSVDYSPTGYYSRDLYQGPETIRLIGRCALKAPLPNPSWPKPDRRVRAYRVDMQVNYRRGDHPIRFKVFAGARELRPWQAYASYDLTGGYVLYGHCSEGFVIDRVFGTPEVRPSHFDEPRDPADWAEWDPESAAQVGKWDLRLGYTCIRDPNPAQQ